MAKGNTGDVVTMDVLERMMSSFGQQLMAAIDARLPQAAAPKTAGAEVVTLTPEQAAEREASKRAKAASEAIKQAPGQSAPIKHVSSGVEMPANQNDYVVASFMVPGLGTLPNTFVAKPKTFSSGSRGYWAGDKLELNGRRYQVQVQLVEIGSKPSK